MSDLLERLRKVEHSSGDRHGIYSATNWYRNPDGPEAADEIEHLKAVLTVESGDRVGLACVLDRCSKMLGTENYSQIPDEIARLRAVVDAARKVVTLQHHPESDDEAENAYRRGMSDMAWCVIRALDGEVKP